jgi:hypothetical protein
MQRVSSGYNSSTPSTQICNLGTVSEQRISCAQSLNTDSVCNNLVNYSELASDITCCWKALNRLVLFSSETGFACELYLGLGRFEMHLHALFVARRLSILQSLSRPLAIHVTYYLPIAHRRCGTQRSKNSMKTNDSTEDGQQWS